MRQNRIVAWTILCLLPAVSGCAEFVHMGQISDQDYGSGIIGVQVEQQDQDGTWRTLDTTDGRGKYWILKDHIKSGRQVRFTKPGYYPLPMSENQFLQEVNFQMIPSEGGDELGNDSGAGNDTAGVDRG